MPARLELEADPPRHGDVLVTRTLHLVRADRASAVILLSPPYRTGGRWRPAAAERL